MDTLYAISRDRNSYATLTLDHNNDFQLLMELLPHLKHPSDEISHWFKCSGFPHYLFPDKCKYDYAIARRADVFWLIDGNKQPEISSGDSIDVGNDTFWVYFLEGLHEGDTIPIAIKNPRPEADEDGWNADYDGIYYADNLTERVCDVLRESYSDLLNDILRNDIAENWD